MIYYIGIKRTYTGKERLLITINEMFEVMYMEFEA